MKKSVLESDSTDVLLCHEKRFGSFFNPNYDSENEMPKRVFNVSYKLCFIRKNQFLCGIF